MVSGTSMARAPKSKSEDLSWLFKQIQNIPVLSKEEERYMLKRAKNGDKEISQKFVWHNLPLVIKISGRMIRAHRAVATSPADLFLGALNEGVLSLYRAIDEFNLSYDCRFSTLAVWYIKEAIRKVITFDVSAAKPINTLDKAKNTQSFIAMLSAIPRFDQAEEEIEPAQTRHIDPELLDKLHRAVATLDHEERYIIENRRGFYDKTYTYAELASMLGISMERVRQIENAALRRLFILMSGEEIERWQKNRDGEEELAEKYAAEKVQAKVEHTKKINRAIDDAVEMFKKQMQEGSLEALQVKPRQSDPHPQC